MRLRNEVPAFAGIANPRFEIVSISAAPDRVKKNEKKTAFTLKPVLSLAWFRRPN